jgi:hypothetical protein
MNERIQQLEKQSYTEAMHELGGTYMAFDKEKFAELIVKECMTICEDVAERNDPAIACYYEIKKTFQS